MAFSTIERRFVDTFLGNRNGKLEYFEVQQLLQMTSSEGDEALENIYNRSLRWRESHTVHTDFADFFQDPSSFVVMAKRIRATVEQEDLKKMEFTPTQFRSAFFVENSTGNMVGYYTHDFETVERYLHPGIVMSALMVAQGFPEATWERVALKPFPMPVEEAGNFWAYHAASVWGQSVEVESTPHLEKPFILFNILGSFTLFDIFVRDPNAHDFYNTDFDDKRCAITRSGHSCPTTLMTRQILNATLPPGKALFDYFAGRDLVYLPIPLGNSIVKAIYHPDHHLEYEIALELLEYLLAELEKLPHPPIVLTMTHGSVDGHVAVDALANQRLGREDCYTFPNRARWQRENPAQAGYQENDLCPIKKSEIESVNRQIEAYNAGLYALAQRYPNFKLTRQAELYQQILKEGHYWDPHQQRELPFKREDFVGLDGIHWTPDYSLVMGNQAVLDLNRIFDLNLEFFDAAKKPMMPLAVTTLNSLQKIFYQTIEENRRLYYKNQAEGVSNEVSPWEIQSGLEWVSGDGEIDVKAKLGLRLFIPDISFGIETGRVITPVYFLPEVNFAPSLTSRDFSVRGGVEAHIGSPLFSVFILPEYRYFFPSEPSANKVSVTGGLETNILWSCSTQISGGAVVYPKDEFFTGPLYSFGGVCQF